MGSIFSFLAAVLGVYSLLILIRIIISWFGGLTGGKPVDILSRITDPYLDWWRNNLNLRVGFLDFSPIAGIVFLSILQNILYSISRYNGITVGAILYITLTSIWSVISFIIGFCLLVIIIRFIGYMINCNIYSSFWRTIDSISQPLLYRINRMIFGRRVVGYLKGLFASILVLAVIWIGGGYAVPRLAVLLSKLPL